jgi:uncharacterized membrane protein
METSPHAESTASPEPPERPAVPKKATATQFFLKGLAISLPPILTLVILVWIGQMLYGYVVSPITTGVRFVIAEVVDKSRPTSDFVSSTGLPRLEYCGNSYRIPADAEAGFRARVETARHNATDADGPEQALQNSLAEVAYVPFGEWSVPYGDFAEVASRMRPTDWPATVTGLYMELVTIRYFKSLGSLSALATALTIVGLYFLGRFVTARLGQWVVSRFESLVLARVPVISSVYSSVKQVTDFFFSERPVGYNRVIAVEFPRRGVWTIGFAMGESLMEMTLAAGEPMVSVMIPAAPMPMTGWIISVPKSAVIDLNLTLDQAFQYFLSCGVLVPENQRATPELLHRELAKRLAASFSPDSAAVGRPSTLPPANSLQPTGSLDTEGDGERPAIRPLGGSGFRDANPADGGTSSK